MPNVVDLEKLRPRIQNFIRSRGVPSRYAEDATQETILGAWLAIQDGRYHGPALWPWVRGIAWRQASNTKRRAFLQREVLDPDQ